VQELDAIQSEDADESAEIIPEESDAQVPFPRVSQMHISKLDFDSGSSMLIGQVPHSSSSSEEFETRKKPSKAITIDKIMSPPKKFRQGKSTNQRKLK